MNRRSSSLMILGVAVLAGFLLGVSLDSWRLSTTAVARPQEGAPTPEDDFGLLQADSSMVEGSQILARIVAITTPSVVHIQSERRAFQRGVVEETGSGVIMTCEKSAEPFIVTNRHVIGDADLDEISIHLYDGRVVHPTVKREDKATDLALLTVDAQGLKPAQFGDSDGVAIGHMVLAMGSPFGLSRSVTYGIISAKGRRSLQLGSHSEVFNQDFLQTDAAINPGNSGGPLFDMHGRVVGINTAIASSSGGNEGIGFSIPSNLVERVANHLFEFGRVRRAYLGVQLDPRFDLRAAGRLHLSKLQGARVANVFPATPAARANLRLDDVILAFNGIDVADENHLINLVSLTPVGESVRLVIWRDQQRRTVVVELDAERSSETAQSESPRGPDMGTYIQPMGLTVSRMAPQLASKLGFERSSAGLLVLKVEPASPLSNDIRTYDLIVEVASQPVEDVAGLESILRQHSAERTTLMTIHRVQGDVSESRLVVFSR